MALKITPHLQYELELWNSGVGEVAGLDEAGRGAWAGPVCAAAVILPADTGIQEKLHGVRDSKQMTPEQRNYWALKIKDMAQDWGIGFADHDEIDAMNILGATKTAMIRALESLTISPCYLLLDAVRLPGIKISQNAIIRGDQCCLSIAAASILAKTARDSLMVELSKQYPDYGFENHKGYGTLRHRLALAMTGVSPIHRKTYAPIKAFMDQK